MGIEHLPSRVGGGAWQREAAGARAGAGAGPTARAEAGAAAGSAGAAAAGALVEALELDEAPVGSGSWYCAWPLSHCCLF